MPDLMIGEREKDPLTKCPEPSRELHIRFGKIADGFNADDVMNAALNVMINVIRQTNPRKRDADQMVDRLMAKARQALDNHYYPNGTRRSVFPFHQIIEVPHLDFKRNPGGGAS